ncbi:hypothetical protein PV08_08599 [Exophiala spinifera]|uniref:N-acetyltransferase domain-containing protein n=1 Tax=Exophiala spinifera TaxID=91928 RepID=A0A0D1YE93_9EURO|nr:uncharacterized protein PV08_08599 [Exophiala spinifera]KIW13411.1 hypothetical protein PV08_08599 [Exophiala spinifera]
MEVSNPPSFEIPVPHPTARIILTPPRLNDGAAVIAALNDRRVYMNLTSPPYPYTLDDWRLWFKDISDVAGHNAEKLQQITNHPGPVSGDAARAKQIWSGWVGWFSSIREILSDEDKTDRYLGEITVGRSRFLFIPDEAERAKTRHGNDSLAAGDPNIVWEVGFYLASEHHGRGVMTRVLQTVMSEVLIPGYNVHHMVATYFEHNIASKRVLEKCGFDYVTTVPNVHTLEPGKTGGQEGQTVGLGVMKWESKAAGEA